MYDDYIDGANKNLKLDLLGVAPTGEGELTLSFTIKDVQGNGIEDGDQLPSFKSPGQRAFYVVAYDSANRKFDRLTSFGASPSSSSSGVIDDGGGEYHITINNATYDPNTPPEGYTGTLMYGYVARAGDLLINAPPHYRLYRDFASDGEVIAGDVEANPYVSAANVEACHKCHGEPYQKHGYREAVVGSLPDFVACKTCHYDTREGSDPIWQVMVNDPYSWATGSNGYVNNVEDDGVLPQYQYVADVMNDTHMSHAMEFPYPQSMANCVTCHEGKLEMVINDDTFRVKTCRSCHAVEGINAWEGEDYDEERAPALMELWAAEDVAFHDITDDCETCHKEGGVGSTFAEYHSGYNAMIYNAAGERYDELYTVAVDEVTFDDATNVLKVKFSGTNTATVPTLSVSFYGFDTKDFYISAHTRDGSQACKTSSGGTQGCRLEYPVGANASASTTDDNPLFTEVATGTPGKWEVSLDLTKYIQPNSTKTPTTSSAKIATIPELIAAGTIRKAEIALLPTLKIGEQTVAIDAVSKTVDLTDGGAFVDNWFQGDNELVPVEKCDACHDQLATNFHSPAYGGSVIVCRTCHQGTNAGSHLEMQSRSIDSYAHSIHRFQYFDTNTVDFSTVAGDPTKFNNPVSVARYNRHIEHTLPYFTPLACEACHASGKFNVPDQSKSMPSLLSQSYTEAYPTSNPLEGWYSLDENGVVQPAADRNIGNVPQYVTGAAGRACAGCHRAELINEDEAGELASLNSHVSQMGVLLDDNDAPSGYNYLYAVMDKIMGFFE